jgi:hypothetical protein
MYKGLNYIINFIKMNSKPFTVQDIENDVERLKNKNYLASDTEYSKNKYIINNKPPTNKYLGGHYRSKQYKKRSKHRRSGSNKRKYRKSRNTRRR